MMLVWQTIMNANEVIEMIKALPVAELTEVKAFVLGYNYDTREPLAPAGTDSKPQPVAMMDRDLARQISRRIMTENHELFRKLAQ